MTNSNKQSRAFESNIDNTLESVEAKQLLTVMEMLDDHRQNRLFHLIEQGAHEPALEILKRDNHVSEEELNKSLISACQRGYKLIVQMLVRLKANVNYRDTDGNTPLLISVQNGLTDIVKFLLTKKADVNACNSVGDSALILSIRSSGSMEITEILLKQTGINIDHQNQDGYTAVMKAAEVKDIDTLKILLDEYLNVGCITTSASRYELTNEHKTRELISTLRETVNFRGENVLHIAERCGIGSVFQLLQEHESTKISPLELAVRANDIKSLHIFLDCDFIYANNNKKYLHEAFVKVVQTCSKDGILHFNENAIAMMKALLEHGSDVNKTWFDNIHLLERKQAERNRFYYDRQVNAIQIAAKSGCFKVLELLLSFKARVNSHDFCSSPIHIALSHGHTECAKLLIQHGAKIDFKNVLMLAVEQQVPTYVSFLMGNYQKKMMQYLKKTSQIQDMFIMSLRKGNLEIIGHILDLGARINGKVSSNVCPLAESKNGEVAKLLINRGADVNHIIDMQQVFMTPLIRVLDGRDLSDNSVVEIIQVLLENGASVRDRTWNGRTPLMLAAVKKRSISVMQLLLDHGARLCERDRGGNTALILAVCEDCSENVSCLLQFIKDTKQPLNLQTNEVLTVLMYAVGLRNQFIIKELIDHGVDVNITDKSGNTALLHLLLTSYIHEDEIMRSLIQAGCDVNCQNDNGVSPLMLAANNCLEVTVSVLLDSGAEINAVSKNNITKTALTYLFDSLNRKSGGFNCLEYLLDRGASSSYIEATDFHNLIVKGQIKVIPQIIRCGFGPASIKPDRLPTLHDVSHIMSSFSPLCTALCVGNSALARFFVGNLFLTHSDISLLGHEKLMRQHLQRKNFKVCLDILNEISTQPISLFKLSFVAVSTAVRATPGREVRVNKLPIPRIIKDKLLFKSQDVELTDSEKQILDSDVSYHTMANLNRFYESVLFRDFRLFSLLV